MFPSSQSAPLLFAGFEHVPVLVLQVPAVWQASEAGQVTGGVVCVHTPLWPALIPLQMLPSSQAVPLLFAGFEHMPVLVLQVPAVWQASEAVQVTGGVVCVHTPLSQVLIPLHMFPSSQSAPLLFAGFEHMPVLVLQVPAVWQASEAGQVTGGVVCVHTPLSQVLIPLHMLPSSQSAPLVFAGFEHMPVLVSQVPAVWQASEAVQVTGGVVCVHTPLWQVLIPLHMSPSSPSAPSVFAGFEHMPVLVLQVPAVWQASEAVQVTGGVVCVHTPLWQVLIPLHMLPSSQSKPLGSKASVGQLGPLPVQNSATSHWPVEGRQVVVAGSKTSTHVLLVPLQ